MANTRGEKVNFLKQFHDEKSLQLQKLSAVQFMEVWLHYDKDGKMVKTSICQGYQGRVLNEVKFLTFES